MPEPASSSGNGLQPTRSPYEMSSHSDVLSALAAGLAADAPESGRKSLKVIRARSPDLVRLSEGTGEDLIATSADFIDILLTSLRTDVEVPWPDYEQRTREFGRLKAAQGVPLETLVDLLAVYRRATIELITQPIEEATRREEILALAERRLEDVMDQLTTFVVRGYLEYLDEEHRTRENELYGIAAIVTSMARSLDVVETSEVALIETLAALRLDAGALWLKERAGFRLAHASGLDLDEIEDFTREEGPHVKATVTAIGRSESRVDRGLGDGWNALRAQLRVKGRVVGVMTVGTKMPRVFGASDLLFMAAVADQVAIALDRARQFSSEARTDHLTGLANRKRINDRHGHRAGDAALRLVAQQLQRVVRVSDICARIGGDEFGVAMPETELERAREVGSRLQAAVGEAGLAARSSEPIEVSIGVAAWRAGQDWQAAYEVTNAELYEDKRRRQEARRTSPQQAPAPTIRMLGRASGRRRVAGR